jgi:hypothetical protein
MRIFDTIWDRNNFFKFVGDIESEHPPVMFSEIICYGRNDIMSTIKLGPNKAFGAGWSFNHSSVGDLGVDFHDMIKMDVALCQIQEAADQENPLPGRPGRVRRQPQ